MRHILMTILLLCVLAIPVSAMDFTAPQAPDSAMEYMPDEPETFGEGLWYIIKQVIGQLQPAIVEGAGVCLCLIAVVLLVAILRGFPGNTKLITELVGTLSIGLLLMRSADSLVNLGADTVVELADYGKLLIPVMTSALAAQGGVSASAALYTGTMLFSTLLSSLIAKLLVPLIYMYLCLCIAGSALGEELLGKLRDLSKWVISWGLKIILYVFTGYMGITGVVSGTADASAIKATKLALSGVVPVVGGVISDASETILVSAGVMKSAVGVYGLLAVIAMVAGPFLKIGMQYLLLKATAAICGVFGVKSVSESIQGFSTAMGLVMGMIGTMCLLLLISMVCFMKGVGA